MLFVYRLHCLCNCVCVSPREAVKTSIPVVPACLWWSESKQVSWSHFTWSHLQPPSVEITEEKAITGASNMKQMCNYENRGLHLTAHCPSAVAAIHNAIHSSQTHKQLIKSSSHLESYKHWTSQDKASNPLLVTTRFRIYKHYISLLINL